MNFFLFVLLLFSLMACHKPNPNPELLDPVYLDLQKTLDESKKRLEDEKSIWEEYQTNLKNVVPQTGQIKYAEKRVWESEARMNKVRQKIQYLELRLKTRKKESRKSYLKAFEKELPWPDPKEYEQYKIHKRLEEASMTAGSNKEEVLPSPAAKAKESSH